MEGECFDDLLRLAEAGDRKAAGQLARRFEGPVREAIQRKLGRKLRVRVDTDDIFQSVMITAIADLGSLRNPEEKAFLAWLTAIAERRVLMRGRFHQAAKRDLRKEESLPGAEHLPADGEPPDRSAARAELAQRMREAIGKLPEPDRQVVELRSYESLGFGEIAQRLGLKGKDEARYILQRALRKVSELY